MEFIKDTADLREIYGEAGPRAVQKELRALDRHSRRFVERSPFVLIGSSDGAGNADVTPKGDKPGFVHILDDNTIAIPDRPGNNRLDTLENLLRDPSIGLLFLIPGMNETLRINGSAKVTADAALCAQLAVNGKPARSVIVVTINTVFIHCAKAFMRSQLWNPESWAPRSEMPTLGEILNDQMALDIKAEETDRELDEIYQKTMW